MKRRIVPYLLVFIAFWGQPAGAQGIVSGLLATVSQALPALAQGPQLGVIVRTNLGLAGLRAICLSNSCTVVANLDGKVGLVFLVTPAQGLLPSVLAQALEGRPGNHRRRTRSGSYNTAESNQSSGRIYTSAGLVGHHPGQLLRKHRHRRIPKSAGGSELFVSLNRTAFSMLAARELSQI